MCVAVTPRLHDGRLYCPSARYGGIFVFPLDGSDPQMLSPQTSPGMATGDVDAIDILDDGLLALSSGPPSCVLWYDLKTRHWATVASSNRADKTTLLDYPEHYLDTMVADPPRHRILFSLRQIRYPGELHTGLFEFNTQTHKVAKRFAFPHNGPVYMQAMGQDKLWVCFPWLDEKMDRIFELDMATDRWKLIMSNVTHPWCEVDAKAVESPASGPVRSNRDWVKPEGVVLDHRAIPARTSCSRRSQRSTAGCGVFSRCAASARMESRPSRCPSSSRSRRRVFSGQRPAQFVGVPARDAAGLVWRPYWPVALGFCRRRARKRPANGKGRRPREDSTCVQSKEA